MHSCYNRVFDNLKLTAECETAHSLQMSVRQSMAFYRLFL